MSAAVVENHLVLVSGDIHSRSMDTTVPHPQPCAKVPAGTDSIGRTIWRLPTECLVASRVQVDDNGCWLWTGHRNVRTGYGVVGRGDRLILVHRFVYELVREAIPEGAHVDHLCRVRACCNPAHLEIVTPAENNRRALAARGYAPGICGKGHQRRENGHCGPCDAEYARAHRERANERRRAARAQLRAQGLSSRGRPLPRRRSA